MQRGLRIAIYTRELFGTNNDVDNRAAVRVVPGEKLDLVGLAVHGARNAVDKVLKGGPAAPMMVGQGRYRSDNLKLSMLRRVDDRPHMTVGVGAPSARAPTP